MADNEKLNKGGNNMNSVELRSRVKEYMKQHDISQTEFVKGIDVSQPTLSVFLNGDEVSDKTFDEICRRLTFKSNKLIIDMNDPTSIFNGMSKLQDYMDNLDEEIKQLEDKLSMCYELREKLSKK